MSSPLVFLRVEGMDSQVRDFEHGISALDAGYQRPGLAAVHMLEEGGRVAIIDPCTNFTVPAILGALEARGFSPADVEYVLLTHVHLDHAGGTGALMRRLPRARVVVHPRGARHMADPSKLVAGSIAVYGESEFSALYGDIVAVASERIVEAPDNFSVELQGRRLHFLDTPGHARHHNAIFDERSRCVFAGDIFGISYREFDVAGLEYVFPTTTPTQFEPEAAHRSLDRIMALAPDACFLMHYSRVGCPDRHAAALHRFLDRIVALAEKAVPSGSSRRERLLEGMRELLVEGAVSHGCRLPRNRIEELLALDIQLNAAGIESWLDSGRGA